jgi:DNA-binding response OmpR family regulator
VPLARDPEDPGHSPAGAPGRGFEWRASGKRRVPRVLLVEDDDDALEMYAWALRASGWLVEGVRSGEAVLFAVKQFKPDAVVMDLDLPGLDGIEATRRLKEQDETKHVPIIVFTGADADVAWVQARSAGCSAFLAKPCLPEKLLSLLESLVDMDRSAG